MNGVLLVNKPAGISSFGVLEKLQQQMMFHKGLRRKDLPKIGHGGTLDPFATGLLIVCVGKGAKLARYFLGSRKTYQGIIRFGETTLPGDPTSPITETSQVLPPSLEEIQKAAHQMTLQPYLQTPPMHSAKKKDGKPLYELARAGIEIERTPKLCQLFQFKIFSYEPPRSSFQVQCSSGTYIRTLAKDLSGLFGTVGMLDKLHRTASGVFSIENSFTLDQISESLGEGKNWDDLPCWIPFNRLLQGYPSVQATDEEQLDLFHGKQKVLFNILGRAQAPSELESCLGIYCKDNLIAIASRNHNSWELDRVFPLSEFESSINSRELPESC